MAKGDGNDKEIEWQPSLSITPEVIPIIILLFNNQGRIQANILFRLSCVNNRFANKHSPFENE